MFVVCGSLLFLFVMRCSLLCAVCCLLFVVCSFTVCVSCVVCVLVVGCLVACSFMFVVC